MNRTISSTIKVHMKRGPDSVAVQCAQKVEITQPLLKLHQGEQNLVLVGPNFALVLYLFCPVKSYT